MKVVLGGGGAKSRRRLSNNGGLKRSLPCLNLSDIEEEPSPATIHHDRSSKSSKRLRLSRATKPDIVAATTPTPATTLIDMWSLLHPATAALEKKSNPMDDVFSFFSLESDVMFVLSSDDNKTAPLSLSRKQQSLYDDTTGGKLTLNHISIKSLATTPSRGTSLLGEDVTRELAMPRLF